MVGTKPAQFERFYAYLSDRAGIDPTTPKYVTQTGSGGFDQAWSDEDTWLTAHEAHEYLQRHKNDSGQYGVAIAIEPDDRLVAIDEDLEDARDEPFKPGGLRVRSRSGGNHVYYAEPEDAEEAIDFDAIDAPGAWNIEGRIADFRGRVTKPKVMFAPGSWRPQKDGLAAGDPSPKNGHTEYGLYTVAETPEELATCTIRELPKSWLRAKARCEYENRRRREEQRAKFASQAEQVDPDEVDGQSALFEFGQSGNGARQAFIATGGNPNGEKQPHPIHGSDTGSNCEYAATGTDLITCWRHGVTHNALTWLALASDDVTDKDAACEALGTGMAGSGVGPSEFIQNPTARFQAWKTAKRKNLISENDPVPYLCLMKAAIEATELTEEEIFDIDDYDPEDPDKHLSAHQYNAALDAIAADYPNLNLGREKSEGQIDIEDAMAEKESADLIELVQKEDGTTREAPVHATIQGCARQGKSYTVIEKAKHFVNQGARVGYLLPSHEEGRATYEKAVNFEINAAYVTGRDTARKNYDVNTSSKDYPSESVLTPWDASEEIPDDRNQYHANIQGAKTADFVVLPPEKLEAVEPETFDLLITSEEATTDRLLAMPVSVYKAGRASDEYGQDSSSFTALGQSFTGCAEKIISDIEDLERTDRVHQDMKTAAQAVLDIKAIIEKSNVSVWGDLDEDGGFQAMVQAIRERIARVEPEAGFHDTLTRLRNQQPNHSRKFMNVLYHDTGDLQGVFTFDNGNQKEIFVVGDVTRVFANLPDECTYWFAGNNLPMMQNVHELIHGDAPEPLRYTSDFTPVTDCMKIVRVTGENANTQSADIRKVIEALQNTGRYSGLAFAGSGKRAARLATRVADRAHGGSIPLAKTISNLRGVKEQHELRNSVALPSNSSFAEGVDLPEFDYSAVHSARFSTPRQSYIGQETGDYTLQRSELIRATQNSALRASNVPDSNDPTSATGTNISEEHPAGEVPALIPDKHIDSAIFKMFEAFGIEVTEPVETKAEALAEMKDAMEPRTKEEIMASATDLVTGDAASGAPGSGAPDSEEAGNNSTVSADSLLGKRANPVTGGRRSDD